MTFLFVFLRLSATYDCSAHSDEQNTAPKYFAFFGNKEIPTRCSVGRLGNSPTTYRSPVACFTSVVTSAPGQTELNELIESHFLLLISVVHITVDTVRYF